MAGTAMRDDLVIGSGLGKRVPCLTDDDFDTPPAADTASVGLPWRIPLILGHPSHHVSTVEKRRLTTARLTYQPNR
jgi:hypothetical protein